MCKSLKTNDGIVSVIIPAYNCEKWIIQAIESVLAQSYQNLEIIIIDDGSTDTTSNILDGYKSYSNISCYKIENSGPAIARNFGVSKSKGDLIAFLDSDDIWDNMKIEKQVNYFNQSNCKILLTNIRLIDENNKNIGEQVKNIPVSKEKQVIHFFQGKITQNTPTIMVKKKVFCEFGGFNISLKHKEDHFFLMQVASKYGVNLLDEFLVFRRVWSDSMSSDYKKYQKNPDEIIDYFYKTRYYFYEISIETFAFLNVYLRKEISRYHNFLGQTLLNLGYINEAKSQLKIAIRYHKNIKYFIKLLILYLPIKLNNFIFNNYNVRHKLY